MATIVHIEAPPMVVGMSADAAYQNGYKHGREGMNSPWICCLRMHSAERTAWMDGYRKGTAECDHPYDGSYPPDHKY